MPQRAATFLERLPARLLGLWVRPTVVPEAPGTRLDPSRPVLYVLEVGGLADRTALDLVCRDHGLPRPGDDLGYGGVVERASVDVLKRRQGDFFRQHRPWMSPRLGRLVTAAAEPDAGDLQIVPVAVYWGRAPERESSFWRLLTTENWQIAGRTRKLVSTILHGRNTLVNISEPLSLQTLRASAAPEATPEILQRKLGRILRVHFRQRRLASLGPDQSHRRMLIGLVLADGSVRRAIDEASEGDPRKRARARRNAEKYALEIAADVSYPTVRMLQGPLTRLWTELYDGVQLDGLERLRSVADGREIVYVPCHRSHIDYLLLSYLLYTNGFSLPHVAAGVNLNLPVVGGILRRGGAFFLRRTFAGNPLYAAVFASYLREILQRGHSLEYFVEGGRSRSGRLLPPKGGMLSMTAHAYLRDPRTPVVFVPVYFGYERLLEGRAFTSELAGGKKQKETVFALLKSLRKLREDYGRVFVNVGEPIELDALLSRHRDGWREETIGDERPGWLAPVVDELGTTIMCRINEAASVTPISLLATALLATPRGSAGRGALEEQIRLYHRLLETAHANSAVVVPPIDPHAVVAHGQDLGFVRTDADELGPIVSVVEGQAAPLTYFRNNILHLLTLPALVAAAFTNSRRRSDDELRRLVTLAYPFFRAELFLDDDIPPEMLDQTLDALRANGLLIRRDGASTGTSDGSGDGRHVGAAAGADAGAGVGADLVEGVGPAADRHGAAAERDGGRGDGNGRTGAGGGGGDDDGGGTSEPGWQRAAAGSSEAVTLMRLAQVVMPGLERDYLVASMLARAPGARIERELLETRCRIAARRLATTHGHDAQELHDKYLFGMFLKTLEARAYIAREGSVLSATSRMREVEQEARTMLGEQVRHAILTAVTASTERASKAG